MKKKEMAAFIKSQGEIIEKYNKMISKQHDTIIQKDREVEICMNAAKALKETLEDTQEALSRSRKMVDILRANKESRSLREMAKSLYQFLHKGQGHMHWEDLSDDSKCHWMTLIVQILSGKQLL